MQDFQQREEENSEEFTIGKTIFKTILMTFLILTIIFCLPMLWFIPAINSHINYSKICSANATARIISKATDGILEDMDKNKYNTGGIHVICSDKSHNITDGTLDEDILYEYMDTYFEDNRFNWFVVIENSRTTYSVAQYARQKQTGTSPNYADKEKGAAFYDGTYRNKKSDLDDLYKYVCDNLNKQKNPAM